MQDDADIVAKMEDDIRRLKGRPDAGGAAEPMGACIYDGYNPDHTGTGLIIVKVADVDVSGDYGQWYLQSGDTVPPAYDPDTGGIFMPYVYYDDGFSADSGKFTIPTDGTYLVTSFMYLNLSNGFVEVAYVSIDKLGGGEFAHDEMIHIDGQNPGQGTVTLQACGFGLMKAGEEIRTSLQIDFSGLSGLGPGSDTVAEIPRQTFVDEDPPDGGPYGGPKFTSFFSIERLNERAYIGSIP
jgi:hypothetical protein